MKLKTFIKLMAMLSISTTIYAQSENIDSVDKTQLGIDMKYASYVRMSTEELEAAMERLSINGEDNLDMGVELIKRWTAGS